jgi:uroporphyrinogen III methyltransferase/synthase
VDAFRPFDLKGRRILLPRAAVARDTLPRELRSQGACVDVVEAYRTVVPQDAQRRVSEVFGAQRKVDWVTFTSSSTVENLVRLAGVAALRGVKVASIGPVTTATAKKLGLAVTLEARVYTTDGLIEALLRG